MSKHKFYEYNINYNYIVRIIIISYHFTLYFTTFIREYLLIKMIQETVFN
jgi:hypothetical protein